jgi:hypothetical protein
LTAEIRAFMIHDLTPSSLSDSRIQGFAISD